MRFLMCLLVSALLWGCVAAQPKCVIPDSPHLSGRLFNTPEGPMFVISQQDAEKLFTYINKVVDIAKEKCK